MGVSKVKNRGTIKERVIANLKSHGCYLDRESEFFFGKILSLAEWNAEYTIRKRRVGNRRGGRVLSRVVATRYPDSLLQKSIEILGHKLYLNSKDGLITTPILYKTLKDVCPLWPFC